MGHYGPTTLSLHAAAVVFDVARRVLYRMERRLDGEVFERLLSWVNAIRGTQYRDPVGSVLDDQTVRIPPTPPLEGSTGGDPQLILGNLVCSKDYYDGAASRRNGSQSWDADSNYATTSWCK